MKEVLAATFVLALVLPAQAQDRMTREMCQQSIEALVDLVQADDTDLALQLQSVRVSDDDWCRISAGDPGFDVDEFETLDWRMQDSARWTEQGIAPLALEVRVVGLDPDKMQDSAPTDRPNLDFSATLRQDPAAGMIIVEQAMLSNNAGDVLSVSGVFERVFLSSPSMMQVSMGSAAFKAGLASMTLGGVHENPFAFGIDVELRGNPQAQRDAAITGLSQLPPALMDDASRAALTDYAGQLPMPVGTLEVAVNSERGFGLMQVGLAMYQSLAEEPFGAASAPDFGILLDGLTVTAKWVAAARP